VREFEFTFVVDGQDGRLARGHSLSTAGITNEPFAWAISADNKLILGADTDGYFQMTALIAKHADHFAVPRGANNRDARFGLREKVVGLVHFFTFPIGLMPARAARSTNSTPYCIAAWLPRGRANELHV
jgi:hypothetical protein